MLLLAGMTVDSESDTTFTVPLTLDAPQTFRFTGTQGTHRLDSAINTVVSR